MKRFLLLTILFAALFTIKAQTYEGTIVINTQDDVDNFNYTYVTEFLIIRDSYPGELINLDGLSELDSVGGNLQIQTSYKLRNIEGLSGLISVGGDLDIDNTFLPSVESLTSLTTIKGSLRFTSNALVSTINIPALRSVEEIVIRANDSLKSINLPSLENVRGDFVLINNMVLEELNGLTNLHHIGRELVLYSNPALTNVNAFSGINSIGFRLRLEFTNLTNLDAFSNLDSVNDIFIVNNDKLENLNGLSKLTAIPGDFQIYNNAVLKDFSGLSNINYVGDYYIWDQNNSTWDGMVSLDSCRRLLIDGGISDIDGLSNLSSVEDISVSGTSLTNLNGLANLRKVTGSINMGYNPLLINIDALSNLDTIGAVVIYNNDLLNNLNGLSNLKYTSFLWIFSNSSLTNVDRLLNLTTIERDLQLDDNKKLENVNGFSGLKQINALSVNYNDALKDLNGFSNITELQRLVIGHNPSLSDINGLQNLSGDVDEFYILNNDSLIEIGQLLSKIENIKTLKIENNDALKELGPPKSRVLSTLSVVNNDLLTNLNAFSESHSFNKIEITGNKNLANYCGLYLALSSNVKPEVIIDENGANPSINDILINGPCTPSERSFISVLLGSKEEPKVQTEASGGGMLVLNADEDTLTYWIRLCNLSSPVASAHFYDAEEGEVGQIVKTIFFSGDSASGLWTSSDEQPFTEEMLAELIKGNIYINIHTQNYPEGELRGEITFDKPLLLSAIIDGSQAVPPNNIQGKANANFYISGDGRKIEYNITSSINMLNASLNSAPPGVSGHIVRTIPVTSPDYINGIFGDPILGTDPLPPPIVADLLGYRIYVNLTTINGEIRGQIKKQVQEFPYMTFWAVNDARYGGQLFYYTLSEGYDFSNIEGDITGIPLKDIEDLAVGSDGTIYIVNNIGTSRIYKINPEQFDKDPDTPVQAVFVGDTKLRAGELPGEISSLHFINDTLFGIGKGSKKVYTINTNNGSVTEISELNIDDFRTDGLTVGADSSVYLLKTVLYGPSEIWKFDSFPDGNISFVTSVDGSRKLESLAAHPNGNLYAADWRNLFEINLFKRTVSILDDHFADIEGMAFNYRAETLKPVHDVRKFRVIGTFTDVPQSDIAPKEYKLSNNYPNPFNPVTIIKYSLPEAVHVKLNVYNTLGEMVRTLVNETKPFGNYEINFDASGLPSGVYIYRIETGKFTQSHKMILMK